MENLVIDQRWIKVHAFRHTDRFGVGVFIVADVPNENGPNNQYYMAQNGWQKRALGLQVPSAIDLEESAAQLLMDGLWDCGIRPTETRTHSLGIDAMKNHLNDLRKITFFLLRGDKEARDSLIV